MTTTNDSPQGPKQTPKIKSEAAGGAKPDSVVHSPASQQDFHSQDEAAALPAVSTVSKKFGNVNAITHGVYSCGLRPWERQEDFDNLREDIRKCWKVKGAAQEETAFDIAYWTMMKRRALQASQISFFGLQ